MRGYVETVTLKDYEYKDGKFQNFRLTGKIEVTIDEAKLAEWLAKKAFRNKSRKSKLQSGIITAKAKDIIRENY